MIKAIITIILIIFMITPAYGFEERDMIDHRTIGISFEKFLSQIKHDKIVEDSGLLKIYRSGIHILSLSDKKGLEDKVVRFVEIFSANFKIMNGIYVGMPVRDLIKLFPNVQLELDSSEGDNEYFSPVPLQKKAPDGSRDIVTLIYVHSKDGGFVGTGQDGDYPLSKFRTDGVVTSLCIFKWH